jgi:hypothetical protein
MPTEELENELRSVFTRAAADIKDPEGAGQRLLQRDYRPGRGHRQLTAGITAAAGVALAAGASATGLTLIGSGPPALATVTSALTRTLTQSYHLTDRASIYTIWNNGRIRYPGRFTCVSEADPVRHLAAFTCSYGTRERVVGGYRYIYVAHPDYQPDKHWLLLRRNPDTGMSTSNSFTDATPQQLLAQIKKVTKVTVIGPASGPGWTGTRYAFSGTQGADTKLSGTVTVDQQGRARALILTSRQTTSSNIVTVTTDTLTFSDFGAPVTVTPPPADQIYNPFLAG